MVFLGASNGSPLVAAFRYHASHKPEVAGSNWYVRWNTGSSTTVESKDSRTRQICQGGIGNPSLASGTRKCLVMLTFVIQSHETLTLAEIDATWIGVLALCNGVVLFADRNAKTIR